MDLQKSVRSEVISKEDTMRLIDAIKIVKGGGVDAD